MLERILRFLFFVGCLALSHCEERIIKVQVDGKDVYRNTAYVQKLSVTFKCLPPADTKLEQNKELAIYKENDEFCKGGDNCQLVTGTEPSLTGQIKESGNYTCKYTKAPEPDVKPATVAVYFGRDAIQIYNDDNVATPRGYQFRLTNESSYRLVCPGGEAKEKVTWYRNGHLIKNDHYYEVNDTNYNLTIKSKGLKVLESNRFGGYYMCERVFEDANRPALRSFLAVESPAYASSAHKSYNKMEGESVTMVCDIEGEPSPKVDWKRKDKDLTADALKRISYGAYKGIPGASMTIENLNDDDYGEYTCIADGGDTKAENTITLRVRNKLAALWPFLGIVAEVIILVAIIFIYEKRRAKKEQEENEDAADQKKSLTASNNENKEIRQRKV